MKVDITAYGQGDIRKNPQSNANELEYIARMSEEMARMAAHCDKKFIAYLLSMVFLAAREEKSHGPCANDTGSSGGGKD